MFRRARLLSLPALIALLTACPVDPGTPPADQPVEAFDEFPGLSAEVEVIIDERGIPHIYASNDYDLAFASGYQMASDRLFQMELLRRRALGRQAEVLGPDFVDQDIISRTFNLAYYGGLNAERLREEDPESYNFVISWLAGVNARVADVQSGAAPLPYGFAEAGFMPETWERDDEFAIAKLMMLGNSNNLDSEVLATVLQRNLPDAWNAFELGKPAFPIAIMPDDEIPAANKPGSRPSTLAQAGPPAATDPLSPSAVEEGIRRLRHAFGHVGPIGSNNWALDGRHTDNGRPLIANDPHQPLESPSLMYALHINSADKGGTLDVAGFAFSGTLGVQLGHNRNIQWAATTNFADVMDIWEVRVDEQGVWAGDIHVDWQPRTEVIAVAGGDPVMLELFDVPDYGVILPESLLPLPIAGVGKQLLVNWTGFAATAEERCFATMMRARNLEEWEAGVDHMEVGGFNFVGASADGIAYRVNIHVPDRDLSSGALPYLVMNGDDASSFWTRGFLPPEQLPRSHAATRGWIGTANNDPWGFTFDGDVTNDPFYYGYFYAPGFRAKRIHEELERLAGQGNVSVADMQALQTDTHSKLSDMLLPMLADAVGQIGTDPELAAYEGDADIQALADLLAGWDQNMQRDSAAALVWHAWAHNMSWLALQDDLGFLYTLVFEGNAPYILKIPMLAMLGEYSTENLIEENHNWVLVEALHMTAEWLNTRFGGVDPANYKWSDMHGTEFRNPFGGDLDGGWTPTHGGEDTVNVSSSNFYADASGAPAERFNSHDGPIFRVITSFADDGTPEAIVNFPRGNSADPSSPHWDDTLEDWTNGVYEPLPFRRAEVDAVAESSFTLTPEQFPAGE